MSLLAPTVIRNALALLKSGTGPVDVETVLQSIIDALDSVAAGGGISAGRTFGSDPAALTVGTAPIKLNGTSFWLSAIEARGVTCDFANARLTIQAGGEGHYDVDYNLAFKGTNGRGYISGVRVSRGGVESFETDTFDEESLVAANQIGHLDGHGRIVNLNAGDWLEVWIMSSAAGSAFIPRQQQFRICRVDSP